MYTVYGYDDEGSIALATFVNLSDAVEYAEDTVTVYDWIGAFIWFNGKRIKRFGLA